ncbi:MAG: hypothetical protein KKG47_16755 [Proteobacteria bacterium]|nr:hypothetical protein [Pseudomonadota bacterium]MBU1738649.1 hypothetical protein [Pseudomonadota bacterium]
MRATKKISNLFTAGCLGGLVNSLAVWLFGTLGVTAALGVKIAPHLSPAWLYPRIVWGGIWGMIFIAPFLRNRLFLKGLVLSIGPTLIQLFVVFPLQAKKGTMGLDLGTLTPAFVIFYNAIWGLIAAWWLKMIKE